MTTQLEFLPLSGSMGAKVSGVNLGASMDSNVLSRIKSALLEYKVLLFPDQELSLHSHVELGRHFGELAPRHPVYPAPDEFQNIMIIENGPERPPDSEQWHKDMTFRPDPPHCALMQAKALPTSGGDTLFANMHQIYCDLSEPMKDLLADLTAVHDFETGFRKQLSANREFDRLETIRAMPEHERTSIHPVVCTHPLTGQKYLGVDDCFVNRIMELSDSESQSILAMLRDRIKEPKYHVRIKWQVNDLAIWDNICTQHFAVGDYTEYRCMHRVTVNRFHDA